MSTGHENWYIYYPAPHGGGSETLRVVRAMQQRLSTNGVSRVRLEERVGAPTTPTWMEVYEGIENPGVFANVLATAVLDSQLPAEITAARRIERFRCL